LFFYLEVKYFFLSLMRLNKTRRDASQKGSGGILHATRIFFLLRIFGLSYINIHINSYNFNWLKISSLF